ncbi:MAG: hypothetical protein Q7S33_03105, partial [Nanoarchaeota archaeon]|nr:hypothetical protein [Nanoarchaeota archaeon]
KIKTENIKIKLKEVVYVEIEINNGLTATEKIIQELDKLSLSDKIVLMKLKGTVKQGKTGDIKFDEIESFAERKIAYSFLRNISSLRTQDLDMQIGTEEVDNVEEKIIEEYSGKNPTEFNKIMPQLINILSVEKNEDEKIVIFENRLMDELKKILNLQEML